MSIIIFSLMEVDFLGADNGNNAQSITSDVSCCDKVYFYSTCVCVGFYSCVHSMCNG